MSFKVSSKPIIIAATASAVVFGVSGYVWKEEHRPHVLDIYVFSLPSGRSMFIRTPDDYRVLIDGGANSDVIREITKYIPFYSRRIDAVIATNTDGKNVSGLIDVLDRYHVDDIYVPSITLQSLGLASTTDPVYGTFLKRLSSVSARIHEIAAGNTLLFGKSVSAKVVFPVPPMELVYSNASAPEVLFSLNFSATSVTFLGNSSHKVQEFLAATSTQMGKTDAVMVSNSALPANISAHLMSELQPKYVIYSKSPTSAQRTPAKSSSKKPSKIPVDPFAAILPVNRLNIQEIGTIHLVSDGQKLIVK